MPRNYLFPRGLAIKATDGAVSQAHAMRRSRDLKDAADRASAETIASALVPRTFSIVAKAGSEGRLFGSITTADIVAAVEAQSGAVLEKRQVVISTPIKTTGAHSVSVRLHSDVAFPLNLDIVAK